MSLVDEVCAAGVALGCAAEAPTRPRPAHYVLGGLLVRTHRPASDEALQIVTMAGDADGVVRCLIVIEVHRSRGTAGFTS